MKVELCYRFSCVNQVRRRTCRGSPKWPLVVLNCRMLSALFDFIEVDQESNKKFFSGQGLFFYFAVRKQLFRSTDLEFCQVLWKVFAKLPPPVATSFPFGQNFW